MDVTRTSFFGLLFLITVFNSCTYNSNKVAEYINLIETVIDTLTHKNELIVHNKKNDALWVRKFATVTDKTKVDNSDPHLVDLSKVHSLSNYTLNGKPITFIEREELLRDYREYQSIFQYLSLHLVIESNEIWSLYLYESYWCGEESCFISYKCFPERRGNKTYIMKEYYMEN